MKRQDEAAIKAIDLWEFQDVKQDPEEKTDEFSAVEGEAKFYISNLLFGDIFLYQGPGSNHPEIVTDVLYALGLSLNN